MEDFKVQKYGPATGKHGSCTFYKAFKYNREGKSEIISLGQFFFMKIIEGIPVCIGELQLVWEDKTANQDLVSVRLYFLPECTPDGRQPFHGEDEVLAYSEKIILKLDDLAGLVVHNVSWSDGRRAHADSKLKAYPEHAQFEESFKLNSFGLDTKDVVNNIKEEESLSTGDESPAITILSFARYCRYRAVLLRLKNCEDKWLKHAIVCAIGGLSSKDENNRVYFCRETFEHSDLDDLEIRCDHLAPNLKGRLRRRKSRYGTENDSSEESNCSSSFSSQNENVANKIRTGARDTPLRNGFRIDKAKVSKDEQAFLIDLHKYMKSRLTPIGRIPSLGFKQIDLYQFYTLAEDLGGYEQITAKRQWKNIYDALGGNKGSTSAATYTRRHYEKLLLPYERYRNGQDGKGLVHKRKKIKQEDSGGTRPDTTLSTIKVEGNQHVKVKTEPETGDPEATVNGQTGLLAEAGDPDKERALIIKMEIEEMKARKVRKPSGGQKTVRELLHKNGRDQGDSHLDRPGDKRQGSHYDRPRSRSNEKLGDSKRQDLNMTDIKQKPGQLSTSDLRIPQGQPLLSPHAHQHPMFYPMIPLGAPVRGMPPVMPFLLPQFGLQSLPSSVPSSLGVSITASSPGSSGRNFNSYLTGNSSAISATSSNSSSNTTLTSAPPSNHVKPPKGPLTSLKSEPMSSHKKIPPAHSHNEKRNYPPSFSFSSPNDQLYSVDAKKPKLSVSHKDMEKPALNSYDLPVLDLSMKTLRAQEARQQRGESLLFNTSFGRDFKPDVKHQHHDAPQDLSLKVPKAADLSKKPASSSSQRSALLNIPQHRSLVDKKGLPTTSMSVKSEPSRRSSEIKSEKSEASLLSSAYKMPPSLGLGEFPSIGGLPIDMGAFMHPAFPQQLLMHGVFPTPQQLQQIIQGQVSAGLPLATPEFLPGTPLMFPPTFSSIPSSLFSTSSPVMSKSDNSSTNGSSSKR